MATDSFTIVFRKGHPLAAKKAVTFAEVIEYPWVIFKRVIHPALHDLIMRRVEAEHPLNQTLRSRQITEQMRESLLPQPRNPV
jgi:hypothetical protein